MSEALKNCLTQKQQALLSGFAGGSLSRFLSNLSPLVILVDDFKTAKRYQDELKFFAPEKKPLLWPNKDVWPYSGLSAPPDTEIKMLKILNTLLAKPQQILIILKNDFFEKHISKDFLQTLTTKITTGETVKRDDLALKLISLGYERTPLVEEKGQFAMRGDLIDVFLPQNSLPCRLSFFDDEIESIKFFEPETQRSTEGISSFTLIPKQEILLNLIKQNSKNHQDFIREDWHRELKKRSDARNIPKEKRDHLEELIDNEIYFHGIETLLPLFYKRTATLFDYLSPQTILVNTCGQNLFDSLSDYHKNLSEHREISTNIETIISENEIALTQNELTENLSRHAEFFLFENLARSEKPITKITGLTESNQILKAKLQSQIVKIHNLEPLVNELNVKRQQGFQATIVCASLSSQERIQDLLSRFNVPLKILKPDETAEKSRLVHLKIGSLHEGFLDTKNQEWWITDEEIFGEKEKKTRPRRQEAKVFSTFSELSEGDFIIHMDHGIGIFKGLVKLSFDKYGNDFLLIEYLGADKLYVPVDKLGRVQRFTAEEGSVPRLDKLGGMTWKKVRQKAKKTARKLASELLMMQAKREAERGFAFTPHPEDMIEFAQRFDFEETPDQQKAIDDVLCDMESEKPMDRLVCGDVGFGKTEVAIRGAYKAILDHKQVAVLVPTTVLAFQHFTTFCKRFENYPVTIELLSRFRSKKQQSEVIHNLNTGKTDIVIGTHRLLSKDVKFYDLGFLVIDEEHRFGVVHKEKIKKLKSLVDVMTLTATPIPRTLNFALNGIRDLSLITTPPIDRHAIKTYVCHFDETLIRETILKEIKRGGQVFFVHNRVQSIAKVAAQIQKNVPEARIQFAHGQMKENALEKIMIAFMNHDFDVLVCTTIIESGVDIPNTNTMLINRADALGLAQLYQLRGRVGRSHYQAYCYLIVPSRDLMTTKAQKRLTALQKFTELGSGFRIASHDLEIRGAGNILGEEQSGQIAAIGYDLYIHLLKEAIAELQNVSIPQDFEPELTLDIAAKIPEDLIPDTGLRLQLYKDLSTAESFADVEATRDEWTDRFGKLPQEIFNLFELIQIKILCRKLLISSLKQSNTKLFFDFHKDHQIETSSLIHLVQKNPEKYSVTKDGRFAIKMPQQKLDHAIFSEIKDFLNSILSSDA